MMLVAGVYTNRTNNYGVLRWIEIHRKGQKIKAKEYIASNALKLVVTFVKVSGLRHTMMLVEIILGATEPVTFSWAALAPSESSRQ